MSSSKRGVGNGNGGAPSSKGRVGVDRSEQPDVMQDRRDTSCSPPWMLVEVVVAVSMPQAEVNMEGSLRRRPWSRGSAVASIQQGNGEELVRKGKIGTSVHGLVGYQRCKVTIISLKGPKALVQTENDGISGPCLRITLISSIQSKFNNRLQRDEYLHGAEKRRESVRQTSRDNSLSADALAQAQLILAE